MWKLLRNLLLSAVVLAIALKLALWTAAQQQAQWLAASLARWGTLSWSSAGGSFNGEIHLSGVRFQPKPGHEIASLSAAELTLRPPGLLWLLKRAITRDDTVPEQLGLRLKDASLPALERLATRTDPPWFGPLSLVPFETFACGEPARLGPREYQSMHMQPALPQLELDYRLESAGTELRADARIVNAPFATLRLHLELKPFTLRLLDDAAAREALRIGSADLEYQDSGYLDRRNKYCARQTGLDVDTFVERHIAAVQERLKAAHLVPAEGVVEIYRDLQLKGGQIKLLSLPREDIAPAQYDTYDPEEVMRWLNLTARHNNAPPVLFKLFFLAEPVQALAGIDRALVHDPLAEPEPETVVVRPEANPVLATTTGAAAALAPPAATPAPAPEAQPAPAAPAPAETVAAAPASPPAADSSRPGIERLPNREPAASAVVTARPSNTRIDPRIAGIPSAPPPPPGSTAALVWQGPRIDRLPETRTAPRERPFSVVAYGGLSGLVGSRIVLITNAGKEIDGKIAAVDGDGVTVNVTRETGQARIYVERKRILEIRVPRRG